MYRFRSLSTILAILLPATLACGDDNNEPPDEATSFTASLSGENEFPPVETPATGSATLSVENDQITYTVNVTDLQDAVVAHIHVGSPGENGPVRLNLCGTGAPQPPCVSGTGVLATGTNGTTVGDPPISFDDLVNAMRSGDAYVNVHTNSEGCTPGEPGCNPGGEIRGQVAAE